MDSRKFIVGNTYRYTDWFTGGQISMECTHISDDRKEIEFSVSDWEIDGLHHRSEAFTINNNDSNEYVVVYSYKGEECRLNA